MGDRRSSAVTPVVNTELLSVFVKSSAGLRCTHINLQDAAGESLIAALKLLNWRDPLVPTTQSLVHTALQACRRRQPGITGSRVLRHGTGFEVKGVPTGRVGEVKRSARCSVS